MADEEVIYVALDPWVYGDDQRQAQLWVSAEYIDEITTMLAEYEVPADRKLEFSAAMETAAWLVYASGGAYVLKALTPVLQAFLDRHKGKKFRVRVGDAEVRSEGFSNKDTQRMLAEAFDLAAEQQGRAWGRLNPGTGAPARKGDSDEQDLEARE